jgi:uncharacterized protein (TIGR02246 family)
MSEARTVLEQFYDAVQRRDMKAARTFLADDMTLMGLFETYPNADAYITTFTQLMQIVVRLDVKTIFGDHENAVIFMDMVTAGPVNATTLVAEWHQVRSGKIIRAQSAFDGRAFAALFAPAPDVGADEQAIRGLLKTFAEALLGRDAKRRASIWTVDGSVVPPQGGFYQGHEALAQHFETESASIRSDSKATFSNYRFRFINPDTAFVDADLTLNNVSGPDGQVAPVVRIAVASTAVREREGWRIQDQRAHFNAPAGR